MEITGKVFRVLPLVTGQGRNGEWRKQEFVIEIESGQFPKKLCLSLWGDKIEQSPLNEGEQVKVFFDIESKEYNGRWFTEARSWRVEKAGAGAPQSAPVEEAYNPPLESGSTADDLPF
ncbi:MAG: DUF3127 domain-containing protein [Bacteroidales bacterium]|nr:DUF3127 domain-containing protein [Bacteroidales bacterium]